MKLYFGVFLGRYDDRNYFFCYVLRMLGVSGFFGFFWGMFRF